MSRKCHRLHTTRLRPSAKCAMSIMLKVHFQIFWGALSIRRVPPIGLWDAVKIRKNIPWNLSRFLVRGFSKSVFQHYMGACCYQTDCWIMRSCFLSVNLSIETAHAQALLAAYAAMLGRWFQNIAGAARDVALTTPVLRKEMLGVQMPWNIICYPLSRY